VVTWFVAVDDTRNAMTRRAFTWAAADSLPDVSTADTRYQYA
jgi:hypothetical protein